MKTIILIKGNSKSGKSEVIREVFNIINTGKTFKVHIIDKVDVKAEGFYQNINIGIESQGDPNSRQGQSLKEFANNSCDIIICASRTRGETYENVISISKHYNYQLITTSTFYNKFNNNLKTITILNTEKTNSIVNIINKIK